MKTIDLAKELERLIGVEAAVSDDEICFEVDRGPRTDHGGGEDGDEWLEDHAVDELSHEYKEKHQDKIFKIKNYLEDNAVGGTLQWEYGYKGHCEIRVYR